MEDGLACGVTERTVWKWETGTSIPDVDKMDALANVLGKPRDEVLSMILVDRALLSPGDEIQLRFPKGERVEIARCRNRDKPARYAVAAA